MDVTAWSPTLYGPAGAILTDAHDLAEFYRALLRGELLSAEMLERRATSRHRGFGMTNWRCRDVRRVGRRPSVAGVAALLGDVLRHFPERGGQRRRDVDHERSGRVGERLDRVAQVAHALD